MTRKIPSTPAITHLAKSPHAAVATSWCGLTERASRKPTLPSAPVFARDGNEIARWGAFDCPVCRARVEAMARECAKILDAFPVDRPVIRGCGDNSCAVRFPSGGVCTNGGCRCDERDLRAGASALRRYVAALEARIGCGTWAREAKGGGV